MDYHRLFRGIPDGLGLQEDPHHLGLLYRQVEDVCFNRNTPRRIQPARLWFPLGTYLESHQHELSGSRWNQAQRLFEAYRFAEAALAAVQLVSDDRYPEVGRIFDELPQHLRSMLFGLELERDCDSNRDFVRQWFRRSMRIAWFFANNDESIAVRWDIEQEAFERLTHNDLPHRLKLAGEVFDLCEEAKGTSHCVLQAFRNQPDSAQRLPLMERAQHVLEMRRWHLTAFLKAITDASERS